MMWACLLRDGGGRPAWRREEVAYLSGVGLTWYTWLEQGRPISVSEQVIESIARALQLDQYETRYLFTPCQITGGACCGECRTGYGSS